MLRSRIIPCLLVHNGGLVKTIRFASPKYVGDPINAVKIFNEKESDELVVLDIDATVKGVAPNLKVIAHLAAECRMPLCYGGGIRTVEQAKEITGLGVEKVAISAAGISDPLLLTRIADEIGRQSVVAVLDVRRSAARDDYDVWTHNATRNTGRTIIELARELETAGAGEIVVNNIDRDGTMEGYDLELAARVRAAVDVPMTILGGAGSLAHLKQLIERCGVIGVAAGSMFVFKGPYRAVLINYPGAIQKEDLGATL
jgi:imidazole glycerol-phosphate synthase subunit HisF